MLDMRMSEMVTYTCVEEARIVLSSLEKLFSFALDAFCNIWPQFKEPLTIPVRRE